MWTEGYRYDIRMGRLQYTNQACTRARVKISIRDNETGRVIERVGKGMQRGNFFPVWVTIKGKEILIEKILRETSKSFF